jgi:hypothetical protein
MSKFVKIIDEVVEIVKIKKNKYIYSIKLEICII